jgi:hypothetical protein
MRPQKIVQAKQTIKKRSSLRLSSYRLALVMVKSRYASACSEVDITSPSGGGSPSSSLGRRANRTSRDFLTARGFFYNILSLKFWVLRTGSTQDPVTPKGIGEKLGYWTEPGLASRVTFTWPCWPLRTTVRVTLLPGWNWLSAACSSGTVVTAFPSIAVITSPPIPTC